MGAKKKIGEVPETPPESLPQKIEAAPVSEIEKRLKATGYTGDINEVGGFVTTDGEMVAVMEGHPESLDAAGFYTTDPKAINGPTDIYVKKGGIRVATNMLDTEVNIEIGIKPTPQQMKALQNLNADTPVYWDLHKGNKVISGSGNKEKLLETVNKTYPETLPETPPEYIIPELPKEITNEFNRIGKSLVGQMDDPYAPAKVNNMLDYLEQYRNINNASDDVVQLQLRYTKNLAEKIIKEDDLFKRTDTLPAQKIFNKTIDRINKALKTGDRTDAVVAIDSFVNSIHQEFPLSLLPRAFDIPGALDLEPVLGRYLEFAAGGDFTKTQAFKNIQKSAAEAETIRYEFGK